MTTPLLDQIRHAAIVHAELPRGASSGRPEHSPLYALLPLDWRERATEEVYDAVEEITGKRVSGRHSMMSAAYARAMLNRWAVKTEPMVLETRRRDADTLRAREMTRSVR